MTEPSSSEEPSRQPRPDQCPFCRNIESIHANVCFDSGGKQICDLWFCRICEKFFVINVSKEAVALTESSEGKSTPAAPPKKSSGKTPPPGAAKVLVIDDDVASLVFIRQILEKAGYEVDIAETGAEGIIRYRRFAPDLVLLDIDMPRMDGFEVCAKLKNLGEDDVRRSRQARQTGIEEKSAPILFMTAHAEADFVRKAVQVGVAGYIVKPIKPDELLGRIRKHLGDYKPSATKPAMTPQKPTPDEAAAEPPIPDESAETRVRGSGLAGKGSVENVEA